MANRLILLLCVSSLLFFSLFAVPSLSDVIEDDEDLKFLEAEDENDRDIKDEDVKFEESSHNDDDFEMPSDIDEYDDDDVDDGDVVGNVDDDGYAYEDEESHLHPQVDDRDVVVLTEKNFTDFIESNKYVMVEFYAPWCGHCKAMAPEYAAASTELKGWETQKVMLAKVKATEESDLAEKYNVEGFPTLYFFIDGKHIHYHGQRSKQAIVTWIKKKIGPGVENITTTADAERILTAEEKVVLGFLESLVGPESEELAAVSKVHDDVNFYQTVNPDIAKMFHLEPSRKCPSLVLLKKVAEKVAIFDGEFTNQKINEFVFTNKIPLMTILTKETAQMIFESPIKKQVLLFTSSNDSAKVLSTFQEAAKLFQGKLIFIQVEMDDSEIGGPIAEYFGVEGITPNVLGYMRDDNHRYMFDAEITLENLKVFGTDFVEDKLKPYYRSDPIPETNDGDVKIVVGNNFDEIVLDESKDVLLEVYAPWCGYCQALEPTYNKLAKHLHGIESLVIAKMDGTTNEHPKVKASGYPTLLFFPAGRKSSDPIAVNSGRTVVELYKFIKKHASVPFKLHKQNTTSVGSVNQSTTTSEIKDEL